MTSFLSLLPSLGHSRYRSILSTPSCNTIFDVWLTAFEPFNIRGIRRVYRTNMSQPQNFKLELWRCIKCAVDRLHVGREAAI